MSSRKFFLMLLVVVVLGGFACSSQQSGETSEKTLTATDAERVEVLQRDFQQLKADYEVAIKRYDELLAKINGIQAANEVGQFLGSYPEFLLLILDRELDAVERGKEPQGSFTDYFGPIVSTAQSAGVSQAEINKRLDRLVRLAKSGKPLSSWVHDNPERFEGYVAELKKPATK